MSRRILEASIWIAGSALVLGALPARLAAQSERDLDKISKHLRAGAADEAEKLCALLPQRWFDLASSPLGPPRDRAKLSLRGGFKCQIEVEAILGRNARLREPAVVLIENCVPTQVLVILDALGERRYERARAESGEPIDVAYRLQLGDFTKSTSRGPSKE